MRELENGVRATQEREIREFGNEEIRKWSASYKLASDEVNFAQVSNLGKVCATKVTYRRVRKETEGFGRLS